jgi:hypothetical protein
MRVAKPENTVRELRIYASNGDLLQHLWFTSMHSFEMDLKVALSRRDVAFVDVIDGYRSTRIERE